MGVNTAFKWRSNGRRRRSRQNESPLELPDLSPTAFDGGGDLHRAVGGEVSAEGSQGLESGGGELHIGVVDHDVAKDLQQGKRNQAFNISRYPQRRWFTI